MKKLLLVDGNSIMFRAYYATAYLGTDNLMRSQEGVYTNALFAFVNMFLKMNIEEYDKVLVAFDTDKPTKRHLAYDDYKAGRLKMPEELAMQIPLIFEYLTNIGIKHYMKPGYEADDIIGTFAKIGKQNHYEVEIYSSDRDLLQLTDKYVSVNLLKKGMKEVARYTPEIINLEFGLNKDQMIDFKALTGDQSDNIKGIPGVGEKTAIKLLQTYQTIDNMYANKDLLTGKVGQSIIESEEIARLSKMLVTIDVDAHLDITFEDIDRQDYDVNNLTSFFQKYDLHSFVKQIEKTSDKTIEDWTFQVLKTEESIKNALKTKMAIYFEFDDNNYHTANLWGVGLSDGENHYFINPKIALSSKALINYLSSKDYEKYTFDYKALLVFLKWHNLHLENVSFDLLLAAYIINAHLGKEEFKYIVSKFDYDDVLYDENVYGKGVKKGLPEDEKIYQKHITSKAKAIYQLKNQLIEQLSEQDQYSLFESVEMPLSKVLASMEYTGINVDLEELEIQKEKFILKIKQLEQEIYQHAGCEFNIASPKQLGEILFEKLELPNGKKTKTGYSTNVDVLTKLKNKHPIIKPILEFRHVSKLYSTYIEGIKNALFSDNKVHTIFNQALTTTGRLSSIEPNLQNIPIRTTEGKNIRKFFVSSSDNHLLLGADYSQIELRVLAHIADVEELKKSFNQNIDVHSATAQKVFNVETVDEEQRRKAKAVNFGIIYGIGAWSLADDINVTPKEAQMFIDNYLAVYPEIKKYMEDIVNYATTNGYVKTLLNRRRYIPEITSDAFNIRAFGQRTALNAPIQGSAADIIKLAMIKLYNYLEKNHKQTKLILQVHDELILDCPLDEVEEMKEIVPKMMMEAIKLKVDLKTSCATGKTWYDI